MSFPTCYEAMESHYGEVFIQSTVDFHTRQLRIEKEKLKPLFEKMLNGGEPLSHLKERFIESLRLDRQNKSLWDQLLATIHFIFQMICVLPPLCGLPFWGALAFCSYTDHLNNQRYNSAISDLNACLRDIVEKKPYQEWDDSPIMQRHSLYVASLEKLADTLLHCTYSVKSQLGISYLQQQLILFFLDESLPHYFHEDVSHIREELIFILNERQAFHYASYRYIQSLK